MVNQMNQMPLPSNHGIRNPRFAGLKPSTLPHGHGGFAQYWISTSRGGGRGRISSFFETWMTESESNPQVSTSQAFDLTTTSHVEVDFLVLHRKITELPICIPQGHSERLIVNHVNDIVRFWRACINVPCQTMPFVKTQNHNNEMQIW